MKSRFLVFLALTSTSMIALWQPPLSEASAYRWVDASGQVHYSDQIPPQELDRAYSIINKDGVTINSVEQAKSKEQIEADKQRQQQREEQERLARERVTYDHILLDTYTKVSDLEETRDRYISSLEGSIKVAEHKLENLNRDLAKLTKSAANFEREGKPVPTDIGKDIASLQSQVDAENNFIQAQRTQQKEVNDKFAADIQHFKELKAAQQSSK